MRPWLVILCVARTAAADPDAKKLVIDEVVAHLPAARHVTMRAVQRARRAVAIGPTVGAWGAFEPTPTTGEGAVTLGFGAELFAGPVVPKLDDVEALVLDKTKQRLEARVRDGELPHVRELERMAREIYEETKAELLAEVNPPPQTFEKPRFTLALEADRLFHADVWQVRLRLGAGISRVTVGATTAYGFGDRSFRLGPEVTVHALLSDGERTPVVDGFVRYDFELAHRDTSSDMIVIGARFMLDAL